MVRADAYFREELAKIKMTRFCIRKVKKRPLREGDLVP